MTHPYIVLFTAIIAFGVILFLVMSHYKWKLRELTDEYQIGIEELEAEHEQEIDKAVTKALNKSKTVIRGNISEEFTPLFKGFPYQMSDCKFSGNPLDYLVFNGMSALRDDKEGQIDIIFADVKSGNSALSTVQRRIRDAIKEGRIKFETWTINNGEFTIK